MGGERDIREGENIRKDSGRISGGGKRIFRVIFPSRGQTVMCEKDRRINCLSMLATCFSPVDAFFVPVFFSGLYFLCSWLGSTGTLSKDLHYLVLYIPSRAMVKLGSSYCVGL